ncbi:MAG: hypothetical protein ACYCSN_14485 [Acidobacteriaceae bacterium]
MSQVVTFSVTDGASQRLTAPSGLSTWSFARVANETLGGMVISIKASSEYIPALTSVVLANPGLAPAIILSPMASGNVIITWYEAGEKPPKTVPVSATVVEITNATINASIVGTIDSNIVNTSVPIEGINGGTPVAVSSSSTTEGINIADALAPANASDQITLSTSPQTFVTGPAIIRLISWEGVTGTVSFISNGSTILTRSSSGDQIVIDQYVPSSSTFQVSSTTTAGTASATWTTL